ncbi:hypothetical protein MtrunA17_Chr1g0188401 [Medicago truncatula]|uniref:Uncharacterized protein n=1 Tax=Medicago truncatula TaxID=3880 RepID=A0A396JQ99_MEDTR|nr:hypothetical protein MtrunA17_Chr1g0188401 [Medicago truncatula]
MVVCILPKCCLRVVPLCLNLEIDQGAIVNMIRWTLTCKDFKREMIVRDMPYCDLIVARCSYFFLQYS